jgi:hypothetical protein
MRFLMFPTAFALLVLSGCGDDNTMADASPDFAAPSDLSVAHDAAQTHDFALSGDFAVEPPDLTMFPDLTVVDLTTIDLAPVCGTDLSNVGTGDFQITFTMQTMQKQGRVALFNQRSACAPGDFWDVHLQDGMLVVETESLIDGGMNDAILTGCLPLADGGPRHIVIQRVGGTLAEFVTGIFDATPMTSLARFDALPAVATGTSACIGVDATVAFDQNNGALSDLCIVTQFVPLSTNGISFCDGGD